MMNVINAKLGAGNILRMDAMDLAAQHTMRFKIINTNRLAFRTQLARWLIALAARVMGMRCLIVEIDQQK